MIFHDFCMTKKKEFPWPISTANFFEIDDTQFTNAYQKKIYFQLLVNQSVSKTSETTNRMIFTETKILVHFYKKSQDIIIIFHDFPWPWLFSMTFQAWKMVLLNSMTFHHFPGRVVTLLLCHGCFDNPSKKPLAYKWLHHSGAFMKALGYTGSYQNIHVLISK